MSISFTNISHKISCKYDEGQNRRLYPEEKKVAINEKKVEKVLVHIMKKKSTQVNQQKDEQWSF